MKRTIKKAVILFGVLGLSLGSVINVEAASWHKGTPKVLRGSWYTKSQKLVVSKNSIFLYQRGHAASVSAVKKIDYRYVGNRTYQYRQYWKAGGHYTGKIKINAKGTYIKFSGISNLMHK